MIKDAIGFLFPLRLVLWQEILELWIAEVNSTERRQKSQKRFIRRDKEKNQRSVIRPPEHITEIRRRDEAYNKKIPYKQS